MDRPIIRRRGLLGCLSLAALTCAAASAMPADAQQVLAGKGAVTIDLGVLNQLGQPVAGGYAPQGGTYPAYGQPAYGQPAYGQPYTQPYAPGYLQTYGGLQFPPQQYPVSSLMVQPPAGSTPYVPSAAAVSAPAMTSSAPATTTSATTTMAASSGASTTTGTPPPAPSPTPTTVPMLPATTDTGSAATTSTTTTDTSSPAATVTTTTGATTDTTGGTTAATTGSGTTTASTSGTSMVPAATPLATETTGAAATSGTASSGTGTAATGTAATTGTETTPAAPAASGAAATGTTASGTQTASVAPGTATATEGEIRIAFPADSADIPDATKGQLDALAQKMAGDENIRIQLLAYASGTSDQASRARRMSLSRALAVRSYLIKAGVRSTRMDVRALGNNVEGSPADRVDIIPKTQ